MQSVPKGKREPRPRGASVYRSDRTHLLPAASAQVYAPEEVAHALHHPLCNTLVPVRQGTPWCRVFVRVARDKMFPGNCPKTGLQVNAR